MRHGLQRSALLLSLCPEVSLADHFNERSSVYGQVVDSWCQFYSDLGIDRGATRTSRAFRLSAPIIEPPICDFNRLLLVLQDLTVDDLHDRASSLFPTTTRYADSSRKRSLLDSRIPKTSYFLWVRDNPEADPNHQNTSAYSLGNMVPGITLLERLLFELKFYCETNTHLDTTTATLCTGSVDWNGNIPAARWNRGTMELTGVPPGYHSSEYRCREVVALQ